MELRGFDELDKKLTKAIRENGKKKNSFLIREANILVGRVKNYTPVDMGVLRNSWKRTNPSNGQIQVVNSTSYAAHVEYGHRQKKRWVPGRFKDGHFFYDKDEKKSGMLLKPKFIKGSKMLHRGLLDTRQQFYDDARRILEDMFK